MSEDWWRWHEAYDEAGSGLEERLVVVQGYIRAFLDTRRQGAIRVVSACAGQGRDLLGVLVDHPRRRDVRARLIELDPRNAAAARGAIEELGLRQLEMVEADAARTDAYVWAVPADLVLMCGVFGNLGDADIRATISALPELCAAEATVIWTRHRAAPDRTPAIRSWFERAGFSERAFDSPGPDSYSVGVHRLAADPRSLELGQQLFTFVR